MTRKKVRRLRLAGVGLVAVGFILGTRPSSDGGDADLLRYGVSRSPSGMLDVDWVICQGESPRTVDVGEDVGGSRTAAGVPVYWQIRSDRAANKSPTVERYVVGETPRGFYETIPLSQPLASDPADLISIESPPGGETSFNGMGFALADVPSAGVYRGDYQVVSDAQFAQEGTASCMANLGWTDPLVLFSMLLLVTGTGAIALTTNRRMLLVGTGVVVMAAGLVGSQPFAPEIASSDRQPPGAFAPGAAVTPEGRTVLADLTPMARSVHEAAPGFFVARILAHGDYAFVVSCDGSSVQIGESSEIPDGGTGARQLVGCSTPQPVRSEIGSRNDRADLVELGVVTNGIANWHIVVVSGSGDVGPFE